jgi:hypothetical protein
MQWGINCCMQTEALHLAQQSSLDARAFVYILLLIIIAIVGGLVILAVKRRIFNDSREQDQSSATLMESLDRMRRSGEISQEEYDQTRRTIIEKTRAMLDSKAEAPDHN